MTVAFTDVKLLRYFKTTGFLQSILVYPLNDCECNVRRVTQV